MYKTKITSQGTITLPVELRNKYNLSAGDVVMIREDGKLLFTKTPSISEIRKHSREHLIKHNLLDVAANYKNGDGWAAHVIEKYGK